jgi:hypothetical protein
MKKIKENQFKVISRKIPIQLNHLYRTLKTIYDIRGKMNVQFALPIEQI